MTYIPGNTPTADRKTNDCVKRGTEKDLFKMEE